MELMMTTTRSHSKSWLPVALVLMLGLGGPAEATLIDRGLFNDGLGGSVRLIYDTDIDITWLGDANFGAGSPFDSGVSNTDGLMSWQSAMDWAASLTVGGQTAWRLPATAQPDSTCGIQSGLPSFPPGGFGLGCTGSEMGHLFNDEGITSTTPGPFTNVQDGGYWSETEFIPETAGAFIFLFNSGYQDAELKEDDPPFDPDHRPHYAWAVHDGDVSVTPEPSTMLLFSSGLTGLIAWRMKKAKA